MTKKDITKEQIEMLLRTSRNVREAAGKSGLSQGKFDRRARSYGLYNRPNGGRRIAIELQEILDGHHPGYPTPKLAKRLVKAGIKEYRCECCGLDEWNDMPLSLQLDHIDGCSTNHRLENLRLLCPNCHSQTPTYGSKKLVWQRIHQQKSG